MKLIIFVTAAVLSGVNVLASVRSNDVVSTDSQAQVDANANQMGRRAWKADGLCYEIHESADQDRLINFADIPVVANGVGRDCGGTLRNADRVERAYLQFLTGVAVDNFYSTVPVVTPGGNPCREIRKECADSFGRGTVKYNTCVNLRGMGRC